MALYNIDRSYAFTKPSVARAIQQTPFKMSLLID